MAKIRIGYGTDFVVENELVGIKTDTPKINSLDVYGNITSDNLYSVGISTFKSIESFAGDKIIIGTQTLDTNTESGSISDEIIIEGEVTVSAGTTLTTSQESLTVTDNFTLPGITTDTPTAGTTRFNEILGSLEFYTGTEWRSVNSYVDMGNRGRIVIKCENRGLEYIQASTLGNSVMFGSHFFGGYGGGGMSNSVRGVYSGGWNSPANIFDIEYITIATQGNAIDWGANGNGWGTGAISNSTRGIVGGGDYSSPFTNQMEMHLFSTTGSEIDYGDLTGARAYIGTTGCSSSVRGTFNGGYTPAYVSVIDSKIMASAGDCIDFGDLIREQGGAAGASNGVRGVISQTANGIGGYVTSLDMTSGGNTEVFGELTVKLRQGVNSTQTRCIFAGGHSTPNKTNTIEYVQITSLGNGLDFGDLTQNTNTPAVVSDSHGGLGGF